ncbi:hypothetical protein H0B56_04070 [Haloechinothrix sp. YIM 98757]|uniref:DUF3137 domain-containing protein n=1 Tax=Haloechinothrix aidingensis TaxID=2752311 RepID=A0A838A4W7_9PSEU|nr:hypothetical protein [Haloechinothrix aidingensis]MBA0124710.1 hypothetical protein [Haloechinothrix aidingensis]
MHPDTLGNILLAGFGLLVVLSLVAIPFAKKKRDRKVADLARQLSAVERSNDLSNPPSFGVRPRTITGVGGVPRIHGDFDRAIEASYHGHTVLVIDYTLNWNFTDSRTGETIDRWNIYDPGHVGVENTKRGETMQVPQISRGDTSRGITHERHMVQVRTPSVPTLCIQRRMRNFRRNYPTSMHFVSDEDLEEYTVGDARFDELFQVLTAEPAFASAVLSQPVVHAMTSDKWFHKRMVVFEGGALWTQDKAHMYDTDIRDTIDRLIRFGQMIPQDVWNRHRLTQ